MAYAKASNIDAATVAGFGREWERFDQRAVSATELEARFNEYFALFPWSRLDDGAHGADIGCGSGRWARFVAPRVGRLHCVDASAEALDVARRSLADEPSIEFHHASVDRLPFAEGSLDFVYALGVIHHVPDPNAAVRSCAAALRPGGTFLIYVYYALDNRPGWFRLLWRVSDAVRTVVSRCPEPVRFAVSQVVAATVYLPLARLACIAERRGRDVSRFPLSTYRHRSFYWMRNDALDRLGTRVEHRFTKAQVRALLEQAGLQEVVVGDAEPHWCAVGTRPIADS